MGDRRVIHLVDDEESIRKAASFALKTAGYDVVTYASGVEFLKEAKSAAVGYFRNKAGVISLTLASVHWAERMVAIRSWNGFP